jgi:glycosyltransferase involved in cell wall biosynthesis
VAEGAAARVRVLIVLPQPPSLEGGAAARCSVAMIRGLLAHGVRVRALAAHHAFTPAHPVPDDLPVEVLHIEPADASRSLLERASHPLSDLASPAFTSRLRALAQDADVVHFDQVESAHDGPCVDRPSAIHLHYRVRDNPLEAGWPPRALAHRLELALAERRAIARFPWLIASSPVVARSMSSERDVTIAPLSLDVPGNVRAMLDGPPRLGIIGTAAWPPTAAALRRLVNRVWPAVRAQVPEAQLHIAGRGTRTLLEGTPSPGIVLLDEVPSATNFLCGLSALVYPATRGGGMKVKTLESMAVGLPVITTPAGGEGIAPNDGVRVCRSDAELVERAVSMLQDDAARRACGAAARRAFELDHTPARATGPLVELYRRMCAA